jgi:hypothetical protein
VIQQGDYCGIAGSVGGNPNSIQLRLERCGCGSTKVPGSVAQVAADPLAFDLRLT